jgi:tetratricopeptide (TPR) repeat protein
LPNDFPREIAEKGRETKSVDSSIDEDADFRAELTRLSQSFGIGVIQLNTIDHVDTVLLPGRRRLRSHYSELETRGRAACRQALAITEKLVADFPTVPAYRTDLAGSCVNFGRLLRAQGRAQDALEWYAKAMPLLEANLAQDARLVTERIFLRNAHWMRALALTDLKRFAEAVKDWDRAFAADPKFAADLKSHNRYNAAGSGQGLDAAKLDDKEKARLREQALVWLQADLAFRDRHCRSRARRI